MKNKLRFYIELLATTINSSGFLIHSIPKAVFISYLKLNEEYEQVQGKIQQKYDRTSKKNFEEEVSISKCRDTLERKLESFQRRVESLSPITSYEFYPNDSLKTLYKDLYNFYCSKTGHKKEKPLKINKYKGADLISTEKKIRFIAKDYVKIELFDEIRDELAFLDLYSLSDLNIVDSVADACWDVFQSNNNITRKKLIERVQVEYFIKKYDDLATTARQKKVKRTAQQWVNDNRDKLKIK